MFLTTQRLTKILLTTASEVSQLHTVLTKFSKSASQQPNSVTALLLTYMDSRSKQKYFFIEMYHSMQVKVVLCKRKALTRLKKKKIT